MENTGSLVFVRNELIENSTITSSGCELIDSRSILLFDSEKPILIEEVFSRNFKIIISIVCLEDDSDKQNISFHVIPEDNTIEYECYNFDNSLGTGTRKPVEIGTYGDKRVFFHFWIYTMGDKDVTRRLEYSLWIER